MKISSRAIATSLFSLPLWVAFLSCNDYTPIRIAPPPPDVTWPAELNIATQLNYPLAIGYRWIYEDEWIEIYVDTGNGINEHDTTRFMDTVEVIGKTKDGLSTWWKLENRNYLYSRTYEYKIWHDTVIARLMHHVIDDSSLRITSLQYIPPALFSTRRSFPSAEWSMGPAEKVVSLARSAESVPAGRFDRRVQYQASYQEYDVMLDVTEIVKPGLGLVRRTENNWLNWPRVQAQSLLTMRLVAFEFGR